MLRRIGCIAVLSLGLCALIALIVLSWMSRMAPAWYAPPDPGNAAVATLADDFEYEVVANVQQRRLPQAAAWNATITEQQINAWLANRLPKWIAHDSDFKWPASLGTPQVKIESNGISLAVPVGERAPRTMVARLVPALEDGKIRLRIDQLSVGRISMPGEPMTNLVKAIEDVSPETLSDPRLQEAIALLSGDQALDPHLQLEDGRRIVLTRLQMALGKLDLSAVTQLPGQQ